MTSKIFKSIFITAAAVLVLSFFIIFGLSYVHSNSQLEAELYRECEYVKAGYEANGLEYLSGLAVTGARITLVDSTGTVAFDSHFNGEELSSLVNHSDREEIREAVAEGVGFSIRYSDTLKERVGCCAMITEGGDILRVSAPYSAAASILPNTLYPMLILLVATLVIALFAAGRLSSIIVRPINEIDLEHPESAKVYDELKPIVGRLATQNYRISKQMNELRIRENEFNSIISNMNEGMIVINSRTAILSCNESAKRILGIPSGELPRGVLAVRNNKEFRDAVYSALSGKSGYDIIRTEDKFYSIIVTPVITDDSVSGAVIVIIDDTEKENREALRREFTSNVSHELKTPLTSISGFAEIIRDGVAKEEDAKHFAGNIHREAQRLITLVGDIIKLSRLDGGEIHYDEEEVDLYSVAEEVISRLENVAARSKITLLLEGERILIPANRRTVEEMVYNLADNGIKYNREGGFVKIKVVGDYGDALLTVTDNGIGIPADKQDRVFERFYRVDKSHSREIGGTGLGLSIVKHAAACHKAKITLKSEVDVGTQISIRFPIRDGLI